MSERAVNLFLFVDNDIIKELGVVAHDLDGSEDQKIEALKSNVATDFAKASRYPIPVANIKAWLGIDAKQGLPLEAYWYLARTGNPLHIFEDSLQAVGAPMTPLYCTTAIVNEAPERGPD